MAKRTSYFLLFISFFLCADVCTAASQTVSSEKEYLDAVVLLVDAKSGMIGLSWQEEGSLKEEKLSFKVDTDKVDVTNPQNQYLEFSNISVGDHMDVVTIKDQNGKETAVEILDYNASDPNA